MVVVGEPVAGGNLKGRRQRPFIDCTNVDKVNSLGKCACRVSAMREGEALPRHAEPGKIETYDQSYFSSNKYSGKVSWKDLSVYRKNIMLNLGIDITSERESVYSENGLIRCPSRITRWYATSGTST